MEPQRFMSRIFSSLNLKFQDESLRFRFYVDDIFTTLQHQISHYTSAGKSHGSGLLGARTYHYETPRLV